MGSDDCAGEQEHGASGSDPCFPAAHDDVRRAEAHAQHGGHHVPTPGELVHAGGWVEVARQFVLISGAALIYFGVRGLTEGNVHEAVERGRAILEAEAAIGLDIEAGVQTLFGATRVLTTLANWVYIWLHWPVIIVTLFWLHHRHRRDYYLLRNAMFVSGAIGLVIFALWPVAPPRLVGLGFVDTVTDLSTSYRVLQPPALVNRYAAVPSLHVGWNVLVGVTLWRVSSNRAVRVFAVASPLLMAVAVVATANHYVLDGCVGTAVALVGLWGAHRIERGGLGGLRSAIRRGKGGVVEDEPVDPSVGNQFGQVITLGDAPGEHQPLPVQAGKGRFVQQAPVHHGSIELHPAR